MSELKCPNCGQPMKASPKDGDVRHDRNGVQWRFYARGCPGLPDNVWRPLTKGGSPFPAGKGVFPYYIHDYETDKYLAEAVMRSEE